VIELFGHVLFFLGLLIVGAGMLLTSYKGSKLPKRATLGLIVIGILIQGSGALMVRPF